MPRLLALALLTACGSTAAPTTKPSPTPGSRYALRKVNVPGPEGRHSASQTNEELAGTLRVTGTTAELVLDSEIRQMWMPCPDDATTPWPQHQACVPRSQIPIEGKSHHVLALAGEVTRENGGLRIAVKKDKVEIVLACRDQIPDDLVCALASETNWRMSTFGFPELVFDRQ